VILTKRQDKTIKIWSLSLKEEVRTLTRHTVDVNSLAIDGDSIISGSDDKTVRIWEIATGEETSLQDDGTSNCDRVRRIEY